MGNKLKEQKYDSLKLNSIKNEYKQKGQSNLNVKSAVNMLEFLYTEL